MKFNSIKIPFLAIVLTSTTIARMDAQKKNIDTTHDPIVEQLLNEKRKINASLSINDQYKIQIYNGTSDLAKKTLAEFKMANKNTDATIVFQTPNYKVWVGNYRTRMEAERNLIEIKKKYKNVLLIKPSK